MNDVNQRADLTIDMQVDPELYQEQINLEWRSYELGKERFEAAVQKRRDAGHEDKTSYGSRFIGHMVGDLAVALINIHFRNIQNIISGTAHTKFLIFNQRVPLVKTFLLKKC
jgi:hypothetical protein